MSPPFKLDTHYGRLLRYKCETGQCKARERSLNSRTINGKNENSASHIGLIKVKQRLGPLPAKVPAIFFIGALGCFFPGRYLSADLNRIRRME